MSTRRSDSLWPSAISLLWLWGKIAVYLIIAMGSMEVVVVAYQQF
tara:strand:- start:78 stop:212 length:135 start_codon:yes stop_codon:yes gene_type:complete